MKGKNITILHFITTFYNCALRIQTGGATRVLKSNGTVFNKVQIDSHSLRKNVTTNKK